MLLQLPVLQHQALLLQVSGHHTIGPRFFVPGLAHHVVCSVACLVHSVPGLASSYLSLLSVQRSPALLLLALRLQHLALHLQYLVLFSLQCRPVLLLQYLALLLQYVAYLTSSVPGLASPVPDLASSVPGLASSVPGLPLQYLA